MKALDLRIRLVVPAMVAFAASQIILVYSPLHYFHQVILFAVYSVFDFLELLAPLSQQGAGGVVLGKTFGMAPPWLAYLANCLSVQVFRLPPLVCALLVYDALAVSRYSDGRTRCGSCWNVLVGLTEPVCPNCGTRL